ncbi:hypothetical protein F4692_001652 [Nocardioides cavernae]|uniref:DUF1772 domain-containing protein n=1 Tax=Nocardioides cavernae TaxID=1921566 RepID=A0A7Y9H3H9_9ACTN|nr:hypothetical protein [Nocardioides cavernae]NYE36519.1 hypothetical protein [Nocardioides cavernae]
MGTGLGHPEPWLLAIAGAHLGFQLTVRLVVYPALAEVGPDGWHDAHARHSRRIAPLVAVLYPCLLAALVWALAARPETVGAWVAAVGGGVAMAATAASAAPTHGRLGRAAASERGALLHALARADRVRTAGAALCLAGAVLLAA